MRKLDFFREIEHVEVPWGDRSAWVPIYYYDSMSLSVQYLAPTDRIRQLLPSPRLKPLRVSPWHSIVLITAFQFRDSDLGPYNEVSIGFPVTLDTPSPMFTGLLRKLTGMPALYIHHLPVTTQIACDMGVEFAGYPKFVAAIDIEETGEWTNCTLSYEGNYILTLSGRVLPTGPAARYRAFIYTTRRGCILRSEMVNSERQQGASTAASDVRLELGDHPIAQELRTLGLGRLAGYQYTPSYQTILTPVLESHPT